MGEGGEQEFNTNVNFLLEDYGMSVNNGCLNISTKHKIETPKIISEAFL